MVPCGPSLVSSDMRWVGSWFSRCYAFGRLVRLLQAATSGGAALFSLRVPLSGASIACLFPAPPQDRLVYGHKHLDRSSWVAPLLRWYPGHATGSVLVVEAGNMAWGPREVLVY